MLITLIFKYLCARAIPTVPLGLTEEQVTSYTLDATTGRYTSVTDPLSCRTDFTYDSLGNVTQVDLPEVTDRSGNLRRGDINGGGAMLANNAIFGSRRHGVIGEMLAGNRFYPDKSDYS